MCSNDNTMQLNTHIAAAMMQATVCLSNSPLQFLPNYLHPTRQPGLIVHLPCLALYPARFKLHLNEQETWSQQEAEQTKVPLGIHGYGTITIVAISGESHMGLEVGLLASAGRAFTPPTCIALYCIAFQPIESFLNDILNK